MMLEFDSMLESLKAKKSIAAQHVIGDVFVKIHIENISVPIVYTFSNANDITTTEDVNNSEYSPWGFDFVKKRGLNVVSFSALNSETWYRCRDFHLCLEQIFSKVSSFFPYRFAYGSSMGGFGASVFSDVLNVNKLLLINPLSSLNKDIVPFETRFKYGASLDWSGEYNDGSKNNASGYVVFDPLFGLDSKHAKRYVNLERLSFFGVGHAMPAHLQNIGILGELFDRFVSGNIDSDWFYRSIRKRRDYEHYYIWLMSKQNIHLTSLRKSIIKNYFLEYRIGCLCKVAINEKQVNIIRDAALKVDKVDLTAALTLMKLALHFRPEGRGIQKKIKEYESIIHDQ